MIVEARLRQRSLTPTLEEITPYREALAVSEYEVERIVEGELTRPIVRIADWVIADGERLPSPAVGTRTRLVLEPFASQPQLESVYLANTLPPDASGGTLYYAVAE